jgi:hypothetical protein
MAVVNSAVTVGVAATKIATGRVRRTSVTIQNSDAAAIFVGDSGVTTAGAKQGVSVAAAAQLQLTDCPGELYAISAAGTAANAVRVLECF